MILLNKIKSEFEKNDFDLEHESNMVQARILSPIIDAIEQQKITQEELSERTGLTQPFISSILNIRKKLNMEHIALFQKALDIVIQTPKTLTLIEHKHKFYNKEDYETLLENLSENIFHTNPINSIHRNYRRKSENKPYYPKDLKIVSRFISKTSYNKTSSI